MRLVGRFGRVCARLAAAGFLATGAAACAAAPGAAPHVGAGSAGVAQAASTTSAGQANGQASVPAAALAVSTSEPTHVIGDGSPAGCTSAAVVQAVAEGGIITFNCGPSPVTITMTCSNGAALSGLYANFAVYNSVMTDNMAIGDGANPAASGTSGGGSGGAIYTDGDGYNLIVDGTKMTGNTAREGGGAIFFVVDAGGRTLTLDDSTLSGNTSGAFQNAPGIFDEVNSVVTTPTEDNSSVS